MNEPEHLEIPCTQLSALIVKLAAQGQRVTIVHVLPGGRYRVNCIPMRECQTALPMVHEPTRIQGKLP